MKLKKGAMFGLDARIALAIFGALSVISGAALYSAIQEAKVTALITDFNEIGKAWEQYYLDTGDILPRVYTDSRLNGFYELQARDLVEDSGIPGWNGPYLSYNKDDTYTHILRQEKNNRRIMIRTLNNNETWGGGTTGWDDAGWCRTGDSCYINIGINEDDSLQLALGIDEKIDNSDGGDKGLIRYWHNNDNYYRIHYQYAPTQNPN